MDIYEEIVRLRKEGRRGAVATIVNVRGSIPSFKTAKMLVRDDGSIVGLDPWPDLDPRRRFARVEPIRDVDLHMEILPLREIAQPL